MARIGMTAVAGLCLAGAGFAGPARAQAPSSCEQGAAMLKSRAPLIQRIQGFAKNRPTAAQACAAFNQLSANGTRVLKWLDANGSWCQVPEQVSATLKADQERVSKVRAQTCNVAAQQAKMEGQMRQQAQQWAAQGGAERNPLGGADTVVGGDLKLPQGAL